MKKYLMTGIAAVAMGAAMTSCSHDFEPMSQEEINQIEAQKIVQTYEQAFIKTFGQPAASQDWGFGATSALRTRAVVETPSVSSIGRLSYNAEFADAWERYETYLYNYWAENNWVNGKPIEEYENGNRPSTRSMAWYNSGWGDSYYQIEATSVPSAFTSTQIQNMLSAVQAQIPEKQVNYAKAAYTGYTMQTTEATEVTVTPIYGGSNSNDEISYYYYPANDVPTAAEVKTMKKYTIGKLGTGTMNTYSLVYEDASSNCSYTFPANYVICFIVRNTSKSDNLPLCNAASTGDDRTKKNVPNQPEYYGDGNMNADIHNYVGSGWAINESDVETPDATLTTSHVAVFNSGDYSFVGFEDWNDFDYNDLILAVSGVTGGQEITVVEVEEEEEEEENNPSTANLRIMAEDLSASDDTDFDFNDVVFDVYYGAAGTAKIEILAAGGTLPLRIKTGAGDTDADFEEVHGMFGENTNIMINTNASYANSKSGLPSVSRTLDYAVNSAADAKNITIQVKKTVNGVEQWIEMKAEQGQPAAKFTCLPSVVKRWADERESLLTNSTFSQWVQGAIRTWQWNSNIK